MNHATNGNRDTASDANVESNAGNAVDHQEAATAFTSQVRVTFHHTRNRLADIDGLSGKAVLDGIVEAGILATDSPKQVTEVRHRQEKGGVEKTTVVIEEV